MLEVKSCVFFCGADTAIDRGPRKPSLRLLRPVQVRKSRMVDLPTKRERSALIGRADGLAGGGLRRTPTQEKQPGATCFDDFFDLRPLVEGDVIEEHDIARRQRWRELGFDVDRENLSIHRRINQGAVRPLWRSTAIKVCVCRQGSF